MTASARRRASVPHPTADAITSFLQARLTALPAPELQALAGKCGLHPNTLYKMMKGSTRPTLDTACHLLAHLGCPLRLRARA